MSQVASLASEAEALDSGAKTEMRGDARMAELALLLDMELTDAAVGGALWPMGSTLAFSMLVSAALWLVVGVLIYLAV